jgi:hypothetical protein
MRWAYAVLAGFVGNVLHTGTRSWLADSVDEDEDEE